MVQQAVTSNERLVFSHGTYYTISDSHFSVYGERVSKRKGNFLRYWDPKRSKLSAALYNGLDHMPFNRNTNVLYLGASTGTTVSHISDICDEGKVFAVESSYEPFGKLLKLSERRQNVMPILEDANYPEKYRFFTESIDVIYQDISQRNQVQIFNNNAEFFSSARSGLLVLKLRAISSRLSEKQILNTSLEQISGFRVKQVLNLKPYHRAHYLIYVER